VFLSGYYFIEEEERERERSKDKKFRALNVILIFFRKI